MMQDRAGRRRHNWALLLVALALAMPAARSKAQGVGNSAPSFDPADEGARAPTSPLSKPGANDHDSDSADPEAAAKKAAAEPPPSLPGSHAEPIPVAPASRNTADMNPTDALFDAINRGDIATARDALNRGADIDAHNVLGLTPLALSVDLGRNDISFLLLSMRQPADTGPLVAQAAAPTRPVRVSASTPRSTVVPPAPSAGFLGFGGGS